MKVYNGSSWSDQSSGWGSNVNIYAVEYSDTFGYWLVGGESGIIKVFNSTSWTDMTSQAGISGTVNAISAEFQC